MGPKNVPSEAQITRAGQLVREKGKGEAVRTKSWTRVVTYAQERGDRGSAHIQGDPGRYIRSNITCVCSYASNFLSLFIANILETFLVHLVSTKNFWPPRRGSGAQKEVSAKRRHRNRAACRRARDTRANEEGKKREKFFCVLPITHRPPPDTKKG